MARLVLYRWASGTPEPLVTVVAGPGGNPNLFVVNLDGDVYSTRWDGQWSDWSRIGG